MSDALRTGMSFIAVIFALIVCLSLLFPAEIGDLLRRITKLEWTPSGIKIEAAAANFKKAIQERKEESPPESEFQRALTNAATSTRARILWVDDNPKNNHYEMEGLRDLGFRIDVARSNDEAVRFFAIRPYNLIISDIARETDREDLNKGCGVPSKPKCRDPLGLELPAILRKTRHAMPPLIYYVFESKGPLTEEGFPVVTQPFELLQLVGALFD